MNWITQRWRPIWLQPVCLVVALLVAVVPQRAWAEGGPIVIHHTPPQRPGCADAGFFRAQFNRLVAGQGFDANQAHRIEYWVDELQPDAFLRRMLLTPWGGQPYWVAPKTFGPPAECTLVVADAANTAAELLRPPDKPPGRLAVIFGGQGGFGLSPQLITYGPNIGIGHDFPVLKNTTGGVVFTVVIPHKSDLADGKDVSIVFEGTLDLAIRRWWGWGGLGATLTFGDIEASVTKVDGVVVCKNAPFLLAGGEIVAKKQLNEKWVLEVAANLSGALVRPTIEAGPGSSPGWRGIDAGWKAPWLIPRLSIEFRRTL